MRLLPVLLIAAALLKAQTPHPLPADRPGIDPALVVELTLEAAIQAALRDNPDIQISRLDVEAARLQHAGARAAFDPSLLFDSSYNKRATPVSSILGGAASGRLDETSLSATPGLAGLLPTGATYSVSTFLEKQTSGSLFVPLNPQYLSGLRISFEQPLLRGRTLDAARRGIQVTSRNRDLTGEQLRMRVIGIAAASAKTYFQLVAAEEGATVQREAYNVAQKALETNRRLAAQGLIPASDLFTAQAQVAALESAYYRALDLVAAAENSLKTLILGSRQADWWPARFRLVSKLDADPSRFEAVALPIEAAIEKAVRQRPEVLQAEALLAMSRIDQQYATDQARPQLNLYSSYTASGLAGVTANRVSPFGAGLSTVPPQLIGGAGDSFHSAYAQRFPSVQGGIRFSLPVGNRAAESTRAAAGLAVRQAQLRVQQTTQQVAAEVRTAAQNLWSAKARLQSAIADKESAQGDFESQQRKQQSGLTSSFELFTKHTRLVDAQDRELRARADLRTALVEMERSMGQTLSVYRIDVR